MARRKEPIDLLLAKGKKHVTKEEIKERRESEIKAPTENIIAPEYLTEELKQEFNKIANILNDIGIISDLDVTALGRFLVAEHQYEQVTLKMLKMKNITDKYIDYANLQDKFFKQARAAAGDLGLTITSRCKLVLPKNKENEKKKQEDPFDKLFGN